jgi:hypothetical protein
MNHSTTQFITQMKLRELHRQRERLRTAYRALSAEVAAAQQPGERLRRLYTGLAKVTVAGQVLHPDVVNLDLLLHELDAGVLSPDVLALWLRRLEDERAAGELRSEFVYLFGALLEEWARESPGEGRDEESQAAQYHLLTEALSPPPAERRPDFLAALLDEIQPALTQLSKRLREWFAADFTRNTRGKDLTTCLQNISDNIYNSPRLRAEARRFASSGPIPTELPNPVRARVPVRTPTPPPSGGLLQKELADALTILLAELHTWDWPRDGLATRALWTRNKWRLYLDVDLPTACLLEMLGEFWTRFLSRVLGYNEELLQHQQRLRNLLQMKASKPAIDQELRLLRQAKDLSPLDAAWEDTAWEETADELTGESAEGIVVQRQRCQARLRTFRVGNPYTNEKTGQNQGIALIHAEVQLARTAFPDRPLYVVKIDLENYYPTIPHDAIRLLLERIGIPDEQREFMVRFVAPPLRTEEGSIEKMRRGVPMGYTLSGMLAELPMRLLDRYIRQNARVRMVRLIDDLCVLAPRAEEVVAAWQRVHEFCAGVGLRVNLAKCGAVCLGGVLPSGLPSTPPRWGMLELDDRGDWRVCAELFENHRAQTRDRIAAARSIFSRVQLYNANARYLLNALALDSPLGEVHRASVEDAVRRFHQELFGPGRGIVEGLSAAIRERFRPDGGDAALIPAAWVYWPITAGGLGLTNPLTIVGQYAEGYKQRTAVEKPDKRYPGWDRQNNKWSAYYTHLLRAIKPIEPKDTKVMKTLVDDFIARGGDVSAGKQRGLSSYWRWILYTYGPEILQRFGTFRFLITELVPLQLIGQQRLQDTSLDEIKASVAAEGEDIPF